MNWMSLDVADGKTGIVVWEDNTPIVVARLEAKTKKAKVKKKPVQPSGPRHPKLGYKWSCYACGAKFYDLGKDDPICPKCEADQRDRPPKEPKPTSEVPKAKIVRPMAQLLDDEDVQTSSDDDLDLDDVPGAADEMFDDTDEVDDGGLDIDDEDDLQPEGADPVDPTEIDEL